MHEVVEWTVSTYKHGKPEIKEMAYGIYCYMDRFPPELLEVRKAGSA